MPPIHLSARKRHVLKRRLSEAQNHRCCLCGWPLDEAPLPGLEPSDWTTTFEHIIPRHLGGSESVHNLAVSHRICNRERRDRDARALLVEAHPCQIA